MTDKISDDLIDEMLAGMEGVTPGPYFQTGAPWFRDGTGVLAGSPDGNIGYLIADTDDGFAPRDEYEGFLLGDKEKDAAHFARCAPETIRALLLELRAYRTAANPLQSVVDRFPDDALASLFNDARAEAAKAMRKYPQPNYVISKVAEEAGEVVKAAIHCAEDRDTPDHVLEEVRQTMAMLIRLVIEGDQVHGLAPLLPSVRLSPLSTSPAPVSEITEEIVEASCPGCSGTGDQGDNPSYGACDDCQGAGKVKQPLPAAIGG